MLMHSPPAGSVVYCSIRTKKPTALVLSLSLYIKKNPQFLCAAVIYILWNSLPDPYFLDLVAPIHISSNSQLPSTSAARRRPHLSAWLDPNRPLTPMAPAAGDQKSAKTQSSAQPALLTNEVVEAVELLWREVVILIPVLNHDSTRWMRWDEGPQLQLPAFWSGDIRCVYSCGARHV
jgi:hypothetical protein